MTVEQQRERRPGGEGMWKRGGGKKQLSRRESRTRRQHTLKTTSHQGEEARGGVLTWARTPQMSVSHHEAREEGADRKPDLYPWSRMKHTQTAECLLPTT